MKLNAAARKKISSSDFALPGRRYPIEDKSHGIAAKSRAAQFATPSEKATIDRKVDAKFHLGKSDKPKRDKHHAAIVKALGKMKS
jgi:hypothetical protein